MRVEAVLGQRLTSGKQLKTIRGNDKVQVTGLAAHGAIALRDLKLRRRDRLESDTTTVTTTSVCNHRFSRLLTFELIWHESQARACSLVAHTKPDEKNAKCEPDSTCGI